MTTKHTPTPWHVGGQNADRLVYSAEGWPIGDTKVYHDKISKNESAINAAFIVRACNSHETLVEALHYARGIIKADLRDTSIIDAALALANGE